MTKRQLPPEIRAENLTIGRTTFAYRSARHCEHKRNNGTGSTVNGIAAQAANESAAHAIQHLRLVGGHNQALFNLQTGLGTILSFTRKPTDGNLPDSNPTRKLLAEVYRALGSGISWLNDEIEVEQMTEGMLAAARIVQDIDDEVFSGDRHEDDKSRVKILIHYARIAEHRSEIEQRRRERERASVERMRRNAESDSIFG
jgi:hypothetical protein